MGSVTKTITGRLGDVTGSTSYHFSSFEDFMEYESVVNEEGRQDNQSALKELVVGKRYCVTKNISDHDYPLGTIVEVIRYHELDKEIPYQVADYCDKRRWIKPEEVREI